MNLSWARQTDIIASPEGSHNKRRWKTQGPAQFKPDATPYMGVLSLNKKSQTIRPD